MKNEGEFYYQTEVTWTGDRSGELKSDTLPTLQVAAPPEFQGRENAWTPEHLYVASVCSCFMTTFMAIAQNSKLEVASLSVAGRGKLEKIEGLGFQITEILLKPTVVIRQSTDLERANRILQKAEKGCLISNSIRTSVKLEPRIYHRQQPVYPCPRIEEPTGC
jgi:peroxiredoxin-like protein